VIDPPYFPAATFGFDSQHSLASSIVAPSISTPRTTASQPLPPHQPRYEKPPNAKDLQRQAPINFTICIEARDHLLETVYREKLGAWFDSEDRPACVEVADEVFTEARSIHTKAEEQKPMEERRMPESSESCDLPSASFSLFVPQPLPINHWFSLHVFFLPNYHDSDYSSATGLAAAVITPIKIQERSGETYGAGRPHSISDACGPC
jgi:hypothetical protein